MRILAGLLLPSAIVPPCGAQAGDAAHEATSYKAPQRGCWEAYADYLRENGFAVEAVTTEELQSMKRAHGVPAAFEGCQTTLIDGYAIAGHMPVSTLHPLLAERPAIKGISLPGTPENSPGMSGARIAPFTTYKLSDGERSVFAVV